MVANILPVIYYQQWRVHEPAICIQAGSDAMMSEPQPPGKLRFEKIRTDILRDFKLTQEFFLSEDQRIRLESAGKFQRAFLTLGWLTKALFMNVSRSRRFLLFVGVVLIFISVTWVIGDHNVRIDSNVKILGGGILLFVLLLELRDKLLAKDELIAGKSVQLALMPAERPKIEGWDAWLYSRAANDVGGDLIDYLRLKNSHTALVLGDVSGKGLPAALFMAKLQATFRALIDDVTGYEELGHRMNHIFYRDGISNRFASFILMIVEPDRDRVSVLNAGHLPPLHLRSGNTGFLEKGDMALGIRADSEYTVRTYRLNPGDAFIAYSDGVTETQNEAGEFWGKEKLMEVVGEHRALDSSGLGRKILAEVELFRGEAPYHDDLSLIILKHQAAKDRAAPPATSNPAD